MFLDEGTYRSRFASSSSLPGTPFTITSARVQMDLLAPRHPSHQDLRHRDNATEC